MRSQVFIVGEREHGTRELVEAMRAFSANEPIRQTRRSIPVRRPGWEPVMMINDFGRPREMSSDESILESVQGPKRRFLLIHCGDGYHRVMFDRRCRAEAVVWVLSAQRRFDETLVNDVLRATYLGAGAVIVFITDAENAEAADERERLARETLTKYELRGDERTVIRSTGALGHGVSGTAWREGITQLFDALENEAPLPVDVVRPMAIIVGGFVDGDVATVGGVVRGEPVSVGAEVELPVLGKRARIVRIGENDSAAVDRADVGRWAYCALEGVTPAEVRKEKVLAKPGAVRLVRSCVGRVCELNDEEIPSRVLVRGHCTNAKAAIEWLDERYMIPRRAKLVFDGPTPWTEDNYVVLLDPASANADRATLLWAATFDADELELA